MWAGKGPRFAVREAPDGIDSVKERRLPGGSLLVRTAKTERF